MRTKTWTLVIVLAVVGLVGFGIAPGVAAAQDNETETDACEADIDNFDVQTADDTIEGADDPGRVGVSASTSVSNECNVVVQVTFDIPNNMYYQGTSADASGQGLQTEVFEVQPGDVSSFTTELYANQEGEHTVVADVEYFPEGHPDQAQTQDNLMLTFNAVDTGFPDDSQTEDEAAGSNSNDNGTGGVGDEGGNNPLIEFLETNIGVVATFIIGLTAVIGLIKREPILNVFTGGR